MQMKTVAATGTLYTFHIVCPHCGESDRLVTETIPALMWATCPDDEWGCGASACYYLDETGARVLTKDEYRSLAPLQREILLATNAL
jgi:phage terminase large subunit GpA-like protein